MPGRTAAEAIRAYLDPLQNAASCLVGVAKILTLQRPNKLGDVGAWLLNDPDGMVLPRFGRLRAQQRFRIVEVDRERYPQLAGQLRVTTLAYDYELKDLDDKVRWQMHWHPDGVSQERLPHLHIPVLGGGHLPTSRMLFEFAVRWAIELGADPQHKDWEDRLNATTWNHIGNSSWSAWPNLQD